MIALPRHVPWAGLAAAPTAWAANQQLTYMIVPWVCANGVNLIPVLALLFAAIAAAGAFLSWRSLRAPEHAIAGDHAGGDSPHLLAALSVLLALIFMPLIVLQGVAALVVDACAR